MFPSVVAPLNLANAPSLHLLTAPEQTLCSQLRILPKSYLVIKETLVREFARRGGKLRRREARELVKIDVNKTSRVWDFLVQAGVLRVPEESPIINMSMYVYSVALTVELVGRGITECCCLHRTTSAPAVPVAPVPAAAVKMPPLSSTQLDASATGLPKESNSSLYQNSTLLPLPNRSVSSSSSYQPG